MSVETFSLFSLVIVTFTVWTIDITKVVFSDIYLLFLNLKSLWFQKLKIRSFGHKSPKLLSLLIVGSAEQFVTDSGRMIPLQLQDSGKPENLHKATLLHLTLRINLPFYKKLKSRGLLQFILK